MLSITRVRQAKWDIIIGPSARARYNEVIITPSNMIRPTDLLPTKAVIYSKALSDSGCGYGILSEFGIEFIKRLPYTEERKFIYDTEKLLYDALQIICETLKITDKTADVRFINYGSDELIYMADFPSGLKLTFCVNQPNLPHGKMKEEFFNLQYLASKNSEVVMPLLYLANETRELYVTPYLLQARCLMSSYSLMGSYSTLMAAIPNPHYGYYYFKEEEISIVNSCIVAMLIKLFDEEKNLGISYCNLAGGDFVIESHLDFIHGILSHDILLDALKLIVVREFINVSLPDYIELIRKEFSQNIPDKLLKKEHIKMKPEDIEYGIELGLSLRASANS